MNKNCLSALLSCLFLACPSSAHETPTELVLKHPALKLSDGTELHITACGLNIKLSRDIKRMHFGEKKEDGLYEGVYDWQGAKHSIRTLSKLEAELALALYNSPHDAAIKARQDELSKQLELVKNDFANKVLPYSDHNHFGDLTMQFIEESCAYHKRTDSFMLTWGKVPRGEERQYLYSNMRSFRDLDVFCTDLINFLVDFINSSPKSVERIKERQHNKHIATTAPSRTANKPK